MIPTRDSKIVIRGNSYIILYVCKVCMFSTLVICMKLLCDTKIIMELIYDLIVKYHMITF